MRMGLLVGTDRAAAISRATNRSWQILLECRLDQIVLKSMEEALTEEMIKRRSGKPSRNIAGQGRQLDRRTAIERELSLIEAYERNLVDAIEKGQAMDPLLKKLVVEEARRAELTKELEQLTAQYSTPISLSNECQGEIDNELSVRLNRIKPLTGAE